MQTIYERLGDKKLQDLIDAFYDLIFSDERINHLFANTPKEEIMAKQYKFLTQFFGGPPRYTQAHGHPKLRMRHLPFKITKVLAQVWLENMAKAIKSLDIDEDFKKEIFMRFPPPAAHMVNS